MPFVHQLCGLGAIFAYSNVIFEAGVSEDSQLPVILSTILGGINLLMSCAALCIVEKYGRKKSLIVGLLGLSIVLGLYSLIGYLSDPSNIGGKLILLGFPIFFGFSIGGMMFLYLSEVLPDIGMSLTMIIDWILVFLVVQFYLDVSEAITPMGVFLIFSGTCLLGFFFYWCTMVESKGKSKAEILSLYSGIRTEEIKPEIPLDQVIDTKDSSAVNVENAVI